MCNLFDLRHVVVDYRHVVVATLVVLLYAPIKCFYCL